MFRINSFGIFGGDKRQIYCGRSMAEDGFGVCVCGFDKYGDNPGLEQCSPEEAAMKSDAIILPLPCSRDGSVLNAPFAGEEIKLSDIHQLAQGKPVFCGMKSFLPACFEEVYD